MARRCYKSQSTGIFVSIPVDRCVCGCLLLEAPTQHFFCSCFYCENIVTSLFNDFPFYRRYNVVFMFLTYFLPIGSMTFTYARVGLELWGSQSIGECTQRQLDNIKSKRKVRVRFGNMQNVSLYLGLILRFSLDTVWK